MGYSELLEDLAFQGLKMDILAFSSLKGYSRLFWILGQNHTEQIGMDTEKLNEANPHKLPLHGE